MVLGCASLTFAVTVYDMPLHASTAPLAIPVAFLGALSFASMGMLFAA